LARTNWTPERLRIIRKRLAEGKTAREIAAELGASVDAVGCVITRQGLRAAYKKPPAPPVAKPDLVAQHQEKSRLTALRSERAELLQRLADAERRAQFWADVHASPIPPDIPRREFGSGLREGCAVAMLSDAHIEEYVNPEKVADRNEYTLEISEKRMMRFFEGVRWLTDFQRQSWAVRDVLLWLGGDLQTGFIHDELVETNGCHPTEAILTLRRRLRSGINLLLDDPLTERLIIPCSFGNHGRIGIRKRIKTGAENSFEWLLYNILAEDYADEPRVRFEVTRSAHQYVTAFDRTLHFHHGDSVTYWGGVGGLTIPLNKRVPKWENVKDADLHHIGHFHQLTDLGRTLVNGSVIGYTEYAYEIGADFERPQQCFYLLDSKRGKCNVTPIWVDE
jgi:hypothetical protein